MKKGEFLQEKVGNMSRWIREEIKENIDPNMMKLDSLTEMEVCTLAGILAANKHVQIHRDWKGISALLSTDPRLVPAQAVLTAVRQRPDMHDQLWAYVELFIEVAEQ